MSKACSEECKRKISKSCMGRVPSNKGRTKFDYVPLRIVANKLIGNKNSAGYKGKDNPMFGKGFLVVGEKNPFYGKKHSLEYKYMMSNRLKGKTWEERYGEEKAKRMKENLKDSILRIVWRSPSSYERKIIDLISKFDLPYRYVGNGSFWVTVEGRHLNPDFVSFDYKCAVEVYSRWHKLDGYEVERERLLRQVFRKVVFIEDKDLNSKNWSGVCFSKLSIGI